MLSDLVKRLRMQRTVVLDKETEALLNEAADTIEKGVALLENIYKELADLREQLKDNRST